ncbi:hypothetical protein P153DRAFT_384156 [Dothidotthia symphoricarpi CBS 119687]|uniref:Uncharacterized protein n=1 Tax=Dothidotthia symphoricarpi CBS 119687 TaxID=1392245 RepID=A0A6A6AGL3_9PLEO|nr:uncharacterized protein P153DRAFT_384156 [Dothidotthia symphoricarpi CBS 119687]KAF2130940.1 hypothetical protein P153DRAFT_384156 [Dothidotthia symphoricarpi CBS 119687]
MFYLCCFSYGQIVALFTAGFCVGYAGMVVVRRRGGDEDEKRNGRRVSEDDEGAVEEHYEASPLDGINALPTELWSLIVEHAVVQHLASSRHPNAQFQTLLKRRFVCRVFDKEICHALDRNLTLPQLPYRSFLRSTIPIQNPRQDLTWRNALLASALFNSSLLPRSTTQTLMTSRIKNCVAIAGCLSRSASPSPARNTDLTRRFCAAASSSRHCWSYIFAPSVYDDELVEWGHGASLKLADVYLEVALLVAVGYGIGEVETRGEGSADAYIERTRFLG